MEKKYWIGRKRASAAMARHAASAEARLIHYELAGRYSVKAAQCGPIARHGGAQTSKNERVAPALARHAPPFGDAR